MKTKKGSHIVGKKLGDQEIKNAVAGVSKAVGDSSTFRGEGCKEKYEKMCRSSLMGFAWD